MGKQRGEVDDRTSTDRISSISTLSSTAACRFDPDGIRIRRNELSGGEMKIVVHV